MRLGTLAGGGGSTMQPTGYVLIGDNFSSDLIIERGSTANTDAGKAP